MAIMCVSYDLIAPGKDYKDLIAALKTYPWCWPLQSTWYIETSNAPKDVYEHLSEFLDGNDKIVIVPLALNAGWWTQGLTQEDRAWFRTRLTVKP